MFLAWGNRVFSPMNGFWPQFVSARCTNYAFYHHPLELGENLAKSYLYFQLLPSKQLANACEAARHSSFKQLQGKGYICHIKLAVISGALSSLGFSCIYFLGSAIAALHVSLCLQCSNCTLGSSQLYTAEPLPASFLRTNVLWMLKTCLASSFYFTFLFCNTWAKNVRNCSSICLGKSVTASLFSSTILSININIFINQFWCQYCPTKEQTYCKKSDPS